MLIVPMLKKSLQSTKTGKSLAKKGGLPLKMKFSNASWKSVAPGEVVEVKAPEALNCYKLLFIKCWPRDGSSRQSQQVLRNGLQRCLELCVEQGHSSVALPVVDLGTVLDSLTEAVKLLIEELRKFESTAPSTVLNIHIVTQPDEGTTVKVGNSVLIISDTN
uniref:Macro domain-containing protein n=1 Tax=Knipowitschia caucasica TaxID=637954 RepID=A0AAV2KRT3_KNICA